MTQSTKHSQTAQHSFSFINQKQVVGRFDGGDISALGGLTVFGLLEQSTKFVRGAADSICDTRRPDGITHTIYNLLLQRVLLILSGLRDGIDSNFYRVDPILKMLLGWEPQGSQHAASQPTVSRLENMVKQEDISRVLGYLLDFYISKHKTPPKKIELDIDGSALEAHGQQQYIAFNGHYGFNMYFPLFVFDQDGWLLSVILRPGNSNDNNLALPMIKIIIDKLRKAWPDVEILLRADAAFGDKKTFRWCEAQQKPVLYTIGIKGNNNLYNDSKSFDGQVCRLFNKRFGNQKLVAKKKLKKKNIQDQQLASAVPGKERRLAFKRLQLRKIRAFASFTHTVGNGTGKTKDEPERRVIERIEHTDNGQNRRYVATNIEAYSAQHVYEEIYGKRGRAELFIKEFKSIASPLSCSESVANQFRLIINALAYNLCQLLRTHLPAEMQKFSASSIIDKITRIAVQVHVTSRKIWLRWTSSFPLQKRFLQLCQRLSRAPA